MPCMLASSSIASGNSSPSYSMTKPMGVAVGATAEAVVELLLLTDGERGAFFVMKRTASLIVLASLLQPHPRVDQLDDIGAYEQIIDKGFVGSCLP